MDTIANDTKAMRRPEIMTGWMDKHCFFGWERRFCYIDPRTYKLHYSPVDVHNRTGGKPSVGRRLRAKLFHGNLGTGDLDLRLTSGAEVHADSMLSDPRQFVIQMPHKVYHFRAKSKSAAGKWVESIGEWHEFFLHKVTDVVMHSSTLTETYMTVSPLSSSRMNVWSCARRSISRRKLSRARKRTRRPLRRRMWHLPQRRQRSARRSSSRQK